jgi:DNA-binding MarR family transcriptional regulator
MTARKFAASDIGAACVCLGLQRAARAVARRYDDAFRSLGITSGQFSILAALLGEKSVPLSALADRLGMDRTTLTRNLRPLEANELVGTVPDEEDRRVRGLQLTSKGRTLLDRALPVWAEEQAASNRSLGTGGWPQLRSQLSGIR